MSKYFYFFLLVGFLVFWNSCRKDFDYAQSTGNLEFSRDTVYLDTTFTNIGSSTYGIKVYNRSNKDIEVPIIKLSKGETSSYRLNVDGIPGKTFRDIPILANDSIYIFIELTFNITPTGETEFLYTDSIEFDSGNNLQNVHLVTLIKDAIFLYPGSATGNFEETLSLGLDDSGSEIAIKGFELRGDQLNFTNERPYVIYGYASVPSGKELVVDAGTRVYFHKDSGILVRPNASLVVNGELSSDLSTLENEVIFSGDRLETSYKEVSGQWGTIWMMKGSLNNQVNYLTIRNGTVGIFVEGDEVLDSPTLSIKNTQIYNSASINLWARNAKITAENLVLGNAGGTSLYCNGGGDYSFAHATIVNYWRDGFRTGFALQVDNFLITPNGVEKAQLVRADFINSIIFGNRAQEFSLNAAEGGIFNFNFTNSLLKFQATPFFTQNNLFYNFEDTALYNGVLVNQDPEFIDVLKYNFSLGENSPAIGNAELNTANTIPFDISGRDRTILPDIGAYQTLPKN